MEIDKLKVMLSFMREINDGKFQNHRIMGSATKSYGISLKRVRMKD